MGQEWLRSAGGGEGFHKGNRTPLSVANPQIPVRAADGNDSPPSVASHVSLWGHPDSFQQLLQVLVLVLELVLVLVEAAGASTC